MSRKLQRDALLAELATINELIAALPSRDRISRLGFESRRAEIEANLQSLSGAPDTIGSIALVFGGGPVIGSRAIDADFASRALQSFQDLVAKAAASGENGGLAERGPVPGRSQSRLNITEVVHGSFGFILEEDGAESPQFVRSAIADSLKTTTSVLDAFTDENETSFDSIVENIDPRMFSAVREFVETLYNSDAELKIIDSNNEFKFSHEKIERAFRRASETSIDENDYWVIGLLIGIVPIGRRFELRIEPSNEIVAGKVGPLLSQDYLERIEQDQQVIGKRWKAKLHKKETRYPGRPPRVTLTLLDLTEPD